MEEDLAQERLQNALVTTYLANLVFLKEYDNNLYQRIDSLSKEIESNRYEERYFLEFLKENGEFDIYDNKHNKYLYNKNAKKYNNQAIDSINFDSKGLFINLQTYHFSAHEKYDKSKIEINNPSDSMKLVINDIQEFVDVLKDNVSTAKSRRIKNIDKFIFIGTLLSRHMIGIVNKTKAKYYFVCERDLEIFRLSLFVFDYTLLTEKEGTVVFSIMDDKHTFQSKFRLFHQNNSQYNHTLKYFSTNHNVEEYFDLVFDGLVSNSPYSFDYHRILRNVVQLSFDRINNRNILCSKLKKSEDKSFLKSKPVLYIGAGPSFMDNIDWIKENQNLFIIVAMGATFERLLDYGIRVDIIASIDPSYEIIEELQFNDTSVSKIDKQLLLLSINTHKKIEDKFKKDNIFEFLIMKNLHKEAELQSGYSVGETITTLLLQLGADELYIVGLDFSINQNTGKTHAEGTKSATKSFDLNNIKSSLDRDSFSLHDDLFKVKGNNNNEVYTNRLYNMSLNTLSETLELPRFKNKKIYNLSKTGAYIKNTKIFDLDLFKATSASPIIAVNGFFIS